MTLLFARKKYRTRIQTESRKKGQCLDNNHKLHVDKFIDVSFRKELRARGADELIGDPKKRNVLMTRLAMVNFYINLR
jgi:hypothetical protein